MIESVFYVVQGAHTHRTSTDPLSASRDALAHKLAHVSRIVREKEIGVTDDRVVPFPNPVPDVSRAVDELFPNTDSYEEPWNEIVTFYTLNERPASQLERSITADLSSLSPSELYRRLGDVLGYVTSLPRGPAHTDSGAVPLTKVDLLELMNRSTRAGDRRPVRNEIEFYAHEAARNFHRLSSLKGYCRRAIRSEGFALGRLRVAARNDQLEHITDALAYDDELMLSRIDDGARVTANSQRSRPA